MRRVYCLLFCLFCLQMAFAGSRRETFDAKLQNGLKVCVEVCEDGIFRIQVTPHDHCSESLLQRYQILKTDWAAVAVTKKEDSRKLELHTARYTLKVDKQTGVVSVTDSKGRNLIEQLCFHTSSDKLCEQLGNVINEKFSDLKVSTNSGVIGDENKPISNDKAETGDFKSNSILSVLLQKEERLYGGGSTSRKHIQHRGELLRMWATYQHTEIPTPFMLSSRNWGIFNNTTRKNFFDVGSYDRDQLYIYNTTDEADFYLMFGNSMRDVIDKYTTITGKPYLFPKWAYGLNFGPNMLEGQFDILNDALRFRELGVPCDMFWLEPQWMEKRYDFSTKKRWNYQRFSAEPYWVADRYPKSESHDLLIGRLHALGFHLCLWLCEEYDESLVAEDELAVQAGKPQSGQEHWMDHLMNFVDNGVDGFKLDPSRTIDEHPGFAYYNGRTDKEMHNLNQVLMPKQLFTTSRNHKGARAFQHYTAGWAGTQHWAASTSGDNGGGKTALFDQLNLGMCGFLNTSCDVLAVSKEQEMQSLHFGLFLPWVQINSWYALDQPFYFPEKEKNIYRDYVKLRYSLIPYIYSAALEGSRTGMPIVRSMPLMFPDDRQVDDMVYQYMFGENLLVGIFSDSIYLPKGNWIDYWTGETVAGGREVREAIPDNRAGLLFIREGAIIPYQKEMQYIGEKPADTLIVRVYPKGSSSYALYEDDGQSFDYEQGKVAVTRFECKENNRDVEFSILPVEGDYKGMLRARTYELEIACRQRPSAVRINQELQNDWRYGSDHKLCLTLHQKQVSEKILVTIQ